MDELNRVDWSEVRENLADPTANSKAYSIFLAVFRSRFDYCFPKVKVKIKSQNHPRKEWMTSSLVKCCKKKSRLYKKYKSNNNVVNKTKYLKYKNALKRLLIAQEKKYYADKLASFQGDLTRTWRTLNTLINGKASNLKKTFFDLAAGQTDDSKVIADNFNNYFATVGEQLASKIVKSNVNPHTYLTGAFASSFSVSPTTAAEIISITSQLSNKTSFGDDEIPLTILKSCINPIASILSDLINDSFLHGYFPDELKIAKVCPIYKSGPTSIVSNYRPISILPSMSKIYEKAMQIRLNNYLKSKNILVRNQYGFREQYSPYMALLDIVDKITKSIEDGKVALAIFIDLQKAFDSLDHNILLQKLSHYGIRGTALNWFTSYLCNRTQYVVYGAVKSSTQEIKWGVPQGSILGPMLFLIFINDIVNCSSLLYFILFADDTNILCAGDTLSQAVKLANDELSKLATWFHANNLTLNVKKTNYILFGMAKHKALLNTCIIYLCNQEIERVKSAKFLGVIIDEQLDWKLHIATMVSKVSKSVGIMYKIRCILDKKTLKVLYLSLIQPYLQYCVLLWGSAFKNALNPLVVIQKRALRVINFASYAEHTDVLF